MAVLLKYRISSPSISKSTYWKPYFPGSRSLISITSRSTSHFFKSFDTKCSKVSKRRFVRGETVTTYVEKRNQVCILLYGEADLIRYDYNGNKTIIGQFSNNDIFGEALFKIYVDRELFVLAKKKCKVLFYPYDTAEKCTEIS